MSKRSGDRKSRYRLLLCITWGREQQCNWVRSNRCLISNVNFQFIYLNVDCMYTWCDVWLSPGSELKFSSVFGFGVLTCRIIIFAERHRMENWLCVCEWVFVQCIVQVHTFAPWIRSWENDKREFPYLVSLYRLVHPAQHSTEHTENGVHLILLPPKRLNEWMNINNAFAPEPN